MGPEMKPVQEPVYETGLSALWIFFQKLIIALRPFDSNKKNLFIYYIQIKKILKQNILNGLNK